MAKLKIRKIGNSVGTIFPKEFGLQEGDELSAELQDNKLIIHLEDLNKKHDRELIEEGFRVFEEEGKYLTQEYMKEKFGEWGWGE